MVHIDSQMFKHIQTDNPSKEKAQEPLATRAHAAYHESLCLLRNTYYYGYVCELMQSNSIFLTHRSNTLLDFHAFSSFLSVLVNTILWLICSALQPHQSRLRREQPASGNEKQCMFDTAGSNAVLHSLLFFIQFRLVLPIPRVGLLSSVTALCSCP